MPDHFKKIYKTAWEIKQRNIIEMARDRQPFIDQSQSMNLFVEDLTFDKFTAIQFHAWNNKLKTGSYYIRTRPAIDGQKFTIDPEYQEKFEIKEILREQEKNKTILKEEEEVCLLCSS